MRSRRTRVFIFLEVRTPSVYPAVVLVDQSKRARKSGRRATGLIAYDADGDGKEKGSKGLGRGRAASCLVRARRGVM